MGRNRNISIHAPLAGCDRRVQTARLIHRHFNPRTPCGVRRLPRLRMVILVGDFNPRTPCGVRLFSTATVTQQPEDFNPRTPCGVRRDNWISFFRNYYFNPRTPCGVRLSMITTLQCDQIFQSTHPLRGATRRCRWPTALLRLFQSTHPLRGATQHAKWQRSHHTISIHAPLAGCDAPPGQGVRIAAHFNPRTPCGVRRFAERRT